ncbi:hypothetical protein B9G98_00453 [Wickerhamiella sorbophila]|uniref:Uncharacterized protein n=1 Tax=Wickerhamiella sorbophila TaxID=45607 RepID=A0A2T0FCU6_9ASCO|nr:hypothetical protein B9G98_00453 [Wickerhamiella sorbophila]PRT52833.1 hypothetical protein B9G98_00453 [Wickerhamiella sorbophila]
MASMTSKLKRKSGRKANKNAGKVDDNANSAPLNAPTPIPQVAIDAISPKSSGVNLAKISPPQPAGPATTSQQVVSGKEQAMVTSNVPKESAQGQPGASISIPTTHSTTQKEGHEGLDRGSVLNASNLRSMSVSPGAQSRSKYHTIVDPSEFRHMVAPLRPTKSADTDNESEQSSSYDHSSRPHHHHHHHHHHHNNHHHSTHSLPSWAPRPGMSRSNSLAQLAREHRQSLRGDPNDTWAFYNPEGLVTSPSRPTTPPQHSVEHLAFTGENSNLLYRTGSRLFTERVESSGHVWYLDDAQKSRRTSEASNSSDETRSDDDIFRVISRPSSRPSSRPPSVPVSRMQSRRNSASSCQFSVLGSEDSGAESDVSSVYSAESDDDFGASITQEVIARVVDFMLGLPENSSNGIRALLRSDIPQDPIEKRRFREAGSVGDPAWLLGVAVMIKDFLK